MTRRTRETDWSVHLVIDAERETRDGPDSRTGALRIHVEDSGRWTVSIRTEEQSFSLILQGDAASSVPAMLHQTLSFIFGQAA